MSEQTAIYNALLEAAVEEFGLTGTLSLPCNATCEDELTDGEKYWINELLEVTEVISNNHAVV